VDSTPGIPSSEQLQLLSQVVRDVARSRRLPADDAQDFAQSVHVTLLERNYDVFARFGGRSSLRTFLTTVVRRMLLDWRNQTYGKWRASAAAMRLGPHAVALERLIHRDGHPLHEAIALVRANAGAPAAEALIEIRAQLPIRHRRRMVSEDALRDICDPKEDPVALSERRRTERRTRKALALALRRLTAEDRWLIGMRYGQGRSVQAVAELLNVDAKALYRRYDRLLQSLRSAALDAAAVTAGGTGAGLGQRRPDASGREVSEPAANKRRCTDPERRARGCVLG
jgi:RNA polymerase sigma factor (sigma-70 family)